MLMADLVTMFSTIPSNVCGCVLEWGGQHIGTDNGLQSYVCLQWAVFVDDCVVVHHLMWIGTLHPCVRATERRGLNNHGQ